MIYLVKSDELPTTGNKVLYFYASWMPYHKKMLIMLNKMEEKYKNIDFYAIDIDFFKELTVKFFVKSIPQVSLYRDNKKIKAINGLVLTSAMKSAFAEVYKNQGELND